MGDRPGESSIVDQQYEMVDVSTLSPHPLNANIGDEDSISESIDENGFYGAVIVQKSTGYILAGNHRYKVLKASGEPMIPAIVVDVDDERAKKILTIDNESSRKGRYDRTKLAELLSGMSNLRGSGFTAKKLSKMIENAKAKKGEAQTVTEQWLVVVECDGETQQHEVLELLMEGGYKCRPLIS